MSRSFKHSPCFHLVGRSDKEDKRIANRKFRRAWRQGRDVRRVREIADTYDFATDGLARYWKPAWGPMPEKLWRK